MSEEKTIDPITKALIKAQEGFAAKAYVDAQGKSIGYGHFIRKGEEHLVDAELTPEQAEILLEKDIKSHQTPWESQLTRKLNNAQMAALTSFAYNVGPAAAQKLVPDLNRGNFDAVFNKMREYNKARVGPEATLTVLDALVNRREFEIDLFKRGVAEDDDSILASLAKPFRGKVDAAKDWQSSKSYFQRAKELFTGPQRSVKGFFDDSGLFGQNQQVLEGLYSLNAKLKSGPVVSVDEQAWATRVMEEGRGW